MTFLLLSMVLVTATIIVVRPAVESGPPLTFGHFDGKGVVAVFAGFVSVALFLGIGFSFALVLAMLMKELGHVLGYRLAGHEDARFRLMPLPGGRPISGRAPANDLAAFFIALMGPGLSLAPMIAAFALGEVLAEPAPALALAFRTFAFATGALNFLALLPIWPLDGGRLMRLIVQARFPDMGPLAATAFSALLIGMSWTMHSMLLFLLGLVGALALAISRDRPEARAPLSRAQIRIGFTAYFATLSAFFLAGWWVLRLVPLTF